APAAVEGQFGESARVQRPGHGGAGLASAAGQPSVRDQQTDAKWTSQPGWLVSAEVEPHCRTAERRGHTASTATARTVATVLPAIWPGTAVNVPKASGTKSTVSTSSPTRFEATMASGRDRGRIAA